ncbi:MAG: hypothetical protein QXZ59_02520 [Nitrososphaeria archaeon]
MLNYGTETIYLLGPTFVYYMFNLVKETLRIEKEDERRKKLLNEIVGETNNKTIDDIDDIAKDMQDLFKNYSEYDDETKIKKLAINLYGLLIIVHSLLSNSITMRSVLNEENHRLNNIEKIVSSLAPIIEHITKKTDESYAKVNDLEKEVDKLENDVSKAKLEAGLASTRAYYASIR